MGVPTIVIEIVSPKNKSVTIYKYEDDIQSHGEFTICNKEFVNSDIFKELSLPLNEIFE